jgi:hypothetical protein
MVTLNYANGQAVNTIPNAHKLGWSEWCVRLDQA